MPIGWWRGYIFICHMLLCLPSLLLRCGVLRKRICFRRPSAWACLQLHVNYICTNQIQPCATMKGNDGLHDIMQGVLVMKTMLSIIVCLLLLPSTAPADDENWGNIKHGSSNKVDDYEFYSDGTSSHTIGDYKFYSDGTSENTVGDYTFDSKGGSSHQIGDYTFRSDGRDGNDVGNYHFYDGGSINTLGDYKFRSKE